MIVTDLIQRPMSELEDIAIEWRLFIEDHRTLIISESTQTELTDDIIAMYENRPEDYMDYLKLPRSITWIMLWLNGFGNANDFHPQKTLIVPSINTIRTLREEYRTFISDLQKVAVTG
jgi:hypothetical protein